jgi:hypothetical protein
MIAKELREIADQAAVDAVVADRLNGLARKADDLQAAAESDCGHDDDAREALAWASRAFELQPPAMAQILADAVLSLAERYRTWLAGSRPTDTEGATE